MPKSRSSWVCGAGLCALLVALHGCSLGAYDKCRAKAQGNDDLDSCMAAQGYVFVPADFPSPQAGECWDDRYAGTFPMAYCYHQGPPIYP